MIDLPRLWSEARSGALRKVVARKLRELKSRRPWFFAGAHTPARRPDCGWAAGADHAWDISAARSEVTPILSAGFGRKAKAEWLFSVTVKSISGSKR
jgi:hypothetical protein